MRVIIRNDSLVVCLSEYLFFNLLKWSARGMSADSEKTCQWAQTVSDRSNFVNFSACKRSTC